MIQQTRLFEQNNTPGVGQQGSERAYSVVSLATCKALFETAHESTAARRAHLSLALAIRHYASAAVPLLSLRLLQGAYQHRRSIK